MTAPVRETLEAALRHHEAGRLADAEPLYRQVLAVAPGHPDALHFLGLLAHQSGQPAAAVDLIGAALRAIPGHPPCHLHLGLALQALGRADDALASYRRARELDPGFAEAWSNEAWLVLEAGDAAAALALLDQALARRPDFADAHLNRGNALQAADRWAEALAAYERVLALRPGDARALNNRGQALEALGRTDEAIAAYRAAAASDPGLAAARWNEGLALLRQGRFAEGWPLYEWRFRALGGQRLVRDYPQPRWERGLPLAGRTLFVHYEQGLGDTLQMLRFVPVLAAAAARVVVEVPPSLARLAASLPGNPVVVVDGEPPPPFDLHCPLMSVPGALGTTLATLPATVPYLAAPPAETAAWRQRLGERTAFRIGLVGSGSTGVTAPLRRRALPAAALATLMDLPADLAVEWHCLQRDYRDGDAALLAAGLRDHAPLLTDFAATAGLVGELDLVITVDTAVAHLAGALGKPVWVLLPSAADWRWLEGRDDSPWYPTMRLFRQRSPGDWAGVLDEVRAALRPVLAAPR